MPTTPLRHFRCPNEIWEGAALIAEQTETSVSALIVDFLSALTQGHIEPFSHTPRPGKPMVVLDGETWERMKPVIVKAAQVAFAKTFRDLENPLTRKVVGRSANAQAPSSPTFKSERTPPPKRQRGGSKLHPNKRRPPAGQTMAPTNPVTCKHEQWRWRKLEFGTWCTCGARRSVNGWDLPPSQVTTRTMEATE